MRLASALAAFAICCAAFALSVIAIPLARYPETAAPPLPSAVVNAVTRQVDLPRDEIVALTWSSRKTVKARAAGLVIGVFATPDHAVDCHAAVFEVDGRAVLAYCGPRPLWRPIPATSRERDARELWAFLTLLGALESSDPTTAEARTGIKNLQSVTGWPVTGVFDPASVVWIEAPITPSEIVVRVGDEVEVGAEVMIASEQLVRASVLNAGADVGQRSLSLVSSSDSYGIEQDGAVIGVDSLAVTLGELGLLDDGLPHQVDAISRLTSPVNALAVPPGSIITTETSSCVIVREGASTRRAIVEVVSAVAGVAYVTGELRSGEAIEVDPDRSTDC